MAPVVPTSPPTEFHAKNTVAFTVSPAEYPSSEGWTVKWELAGPSQASVTATTSGDGYLVTLDSASNTLTPGTYAWTLSASKTSPTAVRYTIDSGYVNVLADPGSASAGDQQLTDEAELALLNTAIAARLRGDVARYSIGDRSLEKIDLAELRRMRAALREKIARRKRGGGLKRIAHVFRSAGDA